MTGLSSVGAPRAEHWHGPHRGHSLAPPLRPPGAGARPLLPPHGRYDAGLVVGVGGGQTVPGEVPHQPTDLLYREREDLPARRVELGPDLGEETEEDCQWLGCRHLKLTEE